MMALIFELGQEQDSSKTANHTEQVCFGNGFSYEYPGKERGTEWHGVDHYRCDEYWHHLEGVNQ